MGRNKKKNTPVNEVVDLCALESVKNAIENENIDSVFENDENDNPIDMSGFDVISDGFNELQETQKDVENIKNNASNEETEEVLKNALEKTKKLKEKIVNFKNKTSYWNGVIIDD